MLHICVWMTNKRAKNTLILVFLPLTVEAHLSISPKNIKVKELKWGKSENSKTGTKMDSEEMRSPLCNSGLSGQQQESSSLEQNAYYQRQSNNGLPWINKWSNTMQKWSEMIFYTKFQLLQKKFEKREHCLLYQPQ